MRTGVTMAASLLASPKTKQTMLNMYGMRRKSFRVALKNSNIDARIKKAESSEDRLEI